MGLNRSATRTTVQAPLGRFTWQLLPALLAVVLQLAGGQEAATQPGGATTQAGPVQTPPDTGARTPATTQSEAEEHLAPVTTPEDFQRRNSHAPPEPRSLRQPVRLLPAASRELKPLEEPAELQEPAEEPAELQEPAELEEPKALTTPATLIPVERAAPVTTVSEVAPASAPPVRLAPAPLPLHAEQTKKIANAAAGIRPASFKGITPGESTYDEVVEKMGQPLETTASDATKELVFKLGPFPSVQVTIEDQVVSTIVIHLAEPTARSEVVEELKLADFEPVSVLDDAGRMLGEVYPERGLMFAFQGEQQGQPRVSQVVLERISVEPFLLRVQGLPDDAIGEQSKTLQTIQQLLPDDAEAYGLQARVERRCGRLSSAQDLAQRDRAVSGRSRRAHLAGRHQSTTWQPAGGDASGPSRVGGRRFETTAGGRGRCLLGRLLAATPHHDYTQAMQETVKAIKLAAAEVNAHGHAHRKQARRLLIETELSLAEILSYGPWKQRHSVVPQWLASAEKTANDHIAKDGAGQDALLDVYATSLHCLLVLDGQGAPTKIADTAINLGRSLIAASEDVDYQTLVEWKLGTTLWRAAQIEQQQGNVRDALHLADNAEALLSAAGELRTSSPETSHHLAQLRFLIGSVHAIQERDDTTAAYWYDKAMPQLTEPYPDDLLDSRGLVGEQLVSVAISLWETGRKNKAVSVTHQGVKLIDDAVQAGTFKRTALAVPYQNLAEMYRKLGNRPEAEKMAQLADQYQGAPANEKVRR